MREREIYILFKYIRTYYWKYIESTFTSIRCLSEQQVFHGWPQIHDIDRESEREAQAASYSVSLQIQMNIQYNITTESFNLFQFDQPAGISNLFILSLWSLSLSHVDPFRSTVCCHVISFLLFFIHSLPFVIVKLYSFIPYTFAPSAKWILPNIIVIIIISAIDSLNLPHAAEDQIDMYIYTASHVQSI